MRRWDCLTAHRGPQLPGQMPAEGPFEGVPGANYVVLRRRPVNGAADTKNEADRARPSALPDEAPPEVCGSSDRAR